LEITSADEARAVSLIKKDVEVTLGVGHEDVVRREASMRRAFVNEPDTIDVDPDEYLEKVAEEVQQYFHDRFVDITWPACPFHHRHPLWLRDGYWTCEQLDATVAQGGELRASRAATGSYVVLADRDRAPAG
jgi:hypothetical protein